MRGDAALLAALLLVGTGCSQREHANPLDPANPNTRGRPGGFVALAGNGSITLRWQPVGVRGVLGYQVFRRVQGEPAFTPLSDLLPFNQNHYDDFGLANGIEHRYQLYFMFADGASSQPAEDGAIPGPVVPWATDISGRSLLRLTADGRHVDSTDPAFQRPTQVAVDPGTGVVWTADTDAGTVVVTNPADGTRTTIGGLSFPSAIAVDAVDHAAWVCDEGTNLVYHVMPDGSPGTPNVIGGLSLPIGICVNPRDRSLWVCENTGGSVRHFASDGSAQGAASISQPSRVAVDSSSNEAWITSFTQRQVYRVSPGGVIRSTLVGLSGPIGIAVDWVRHRVWVADAVASTVVVYSIDGTVAFRVPGIAAAREIAVELATGNGWVTAPGSGQIVSISSGGVILSRLTGLGQPYGIALDPGTRFRSPAPPGPARASLAPQLERTRGPAQKL